MTAESKFELTPYKRVLKLARQPTTDEFTKVAAITSGGALLIGAIGFAIYVIMTFLPS